METEYYRIKDKTLNCYFKDAHNSTEIESIKRAILRFLYHDKNDMKSLEEMTVQELFNIENLNLELEVGYNLFRVEDIAEYGNVELMNN